MDVGTVVVNVSPILPDVLLVSCDGFVVAANVLAVGCDASFIGREIVGVVVLEIVPVLGLSTIELSFIMITISPLGVQTFVVLPHVRLVLGQILVVLAQVTAISADVLFVVGDITTILPQIASVMAQIASVTIDVGLIRWGGGRWGSASSTRLRARCVAENEQASHQASRRRL